MTALTPPAMDAPAEEWGRLAVRIPGYRWPWSFRRARGVYLPGYVRRHRTTEWAWVEDIRECSMLDEYAPDPDDAATAGCLLALLGEALVCVAKEGRVWSAIVARGDLEGYGTTPGRAAIAAAAANGCWPGGAS